MSRDLSAATRKAADDHDGTVLADSAHLRAANTWEAGVVRLHLTSHSPYHDHRPHALDYAEVESLRTSALRDLHRRLHEADREPPRDVVVAIAYAAWLEPSDAVEVIQRLAERGYRVVPTADVVAAREGADRD